MFEYRCSACGVTAYSSASYATVGLCPNCDSPLGDEEFVTVPEPDTIAVTRRVTAFSRDAQPTPDGSPAG